jgi:myo-inositol 2-dehydrogenase / D-chiro-inositol 1-dehydrogenase
MLKFGLLGAGRIGRVHAANLASHRRARLAAVYDPDATAAQAVAKDGGAVASVEAILGDRSIDALIIATPAETHAELIELAARAGKAIFCEKPIDRNFERTRRCLACVEETGVTLFMAFNRRFDPSFAALKRRLQEGEAGKPEMVFLTSRDPEPPSLAYIAQSGGLFRDMMIHDFDVARWLVGEEFLQVFAVGQCHTDPRIGDLGFVDTAVVTMTSASGVIVNINCAMRAAYGYDQRVEVHGSHGMLQLGNRFETSVLKAGSGGIIRELPLAFFLERYQAAYVAELDYFISCLDEGTRPHPNGADGLSALILAEAAHQSRARGAPVDVSEF